MIEPMREPELPLVERGTNPDLRLLTQARKDYFAMLRDGTECPCCDRYGKVYRRKFTSAMARFLIAMYRLDAKEPGTWVHALRDVAYKLGIGGDYGKTLLWRLIEKRPGGKDDGNPDGGQYRITEKGRSFVEGRLRIEKHKFVYHDRVMQVEEGPVDELSIREALGAGFDYNELMGA